MKRYPAFQTSQKDKHLERPFGELHKMWNALILAKMCE
jgi:hypothetical protein